MRELADACRITGWLQRNAPDSYAALRAGAGSAAIGALEGDLGIEIPVELRVLWQLTAGDDGVNGWGWGCLPGGETLMPLDAVAAIYRQKMDAQAHEDAHNAGRPEYDRITVWKATWIPVVSHGAADRTSGLHLDAATGYLGDWSRHNNVPGEQLDTLVTYLEEAADMLQAPALATRDKPGLVGGALVWLSRVDPALPHDVIALSVAGAEAAEGVLAGCAASPLVIIHTPLHTSPMNPTSCSSSSCRHSTCLGDAQHDAAVLAKGRR